MRNYWRQFIAVLMLFAGTALPAKEAAPVIIFEAAKISTIRLSYLYKMHQTH